MSIFFTSDTHFSHKNIISLGSGRPFSSIEEHDEALVNNWNSMISPQDTVYHLGDVLMGHIATSSAILGQLNGHKILIPGNHDRVSSLYSVNHQQKYKPLYQQYFNEILPEKGNVLVVDGVQVQLSHYPCVERNWGFDVTKDGFAQLRPEDDSVIIHGHTHQGMRTSWSENGNLQVHVGVDSWDYKPVPWDSIQQIIQSNS